MKEGTTVLLAPTENSRGVCKEGGREIRWGADYLDQLAQAYYQCGEVVRAVESEQEALSSLPPNSRSRKNLEAYLLKFKTAAKGS